MGGLTAELPLAFTNDKLSILASNKDKWYKPITTYNYKDLDDYLNDIPTATCPGDDADANPPISCPDQSE